MKQTRQQVIELSIIIKTLNEEKNIARCIAAILDGLPDLSLEIIVADSGSTDRTIAIAAGFPVTIVQLAKPQERSCGVGPQLGFQHSHGRFVLILDADMVLHASFVRKALARMEVDHSCGGLGGQLLECSGRGYEYEQRVSVVRDQEVAVKWLDGGGLYRREAILSVGYLSNRNLHAYEEKELGLRLSYAGWHMYRTPDVAVDHYGHSVDTIALLWRRWRSGYADACGESIRACFSKPYLLDMIFVHKALLACLFLQLLLIASFIALPWFSLPLVLVGLAILIGALRQVIRKGGGRAAVYSLLYTNVFALGLARGVMKPQLNPVTPIQSTLIKDQKVKML